MHFFYPFLGSFSDNNLNCGGNFSQSCEPSSSGHGKYWH